MSEKDERLAQFCRERGVDGVVLRRRSNIAWVTDGADTHVDGASQLGIATAVWTPARKTVLTDNIEAARLAEEEFGSEWGVEAGPWWEEPGAPEGNFASDWPDDAIAPLRYSLTEQEVKRVRALGGDCADVMQTEMHGLDPGMSEHEVAGRITGALRARGIFTTVILVAADERIRKYRHPIPTDNRIERLVMAAICAQRRGLIVSITRLVHFGPVDADLRARHEACCRVDRALHDGTRSGAKWCDVFASAVATYAAAGYPEEWKKHHQGGPMGYEARDFKATPTEKRTVQENQLVGWNPTVTGTKSEDTILSTGDVVTAMSDWPMVEAGGVNRPDILVRSVA